jgi:hypothetical protein
MFLVRHDDVSSLGTLFVGRSGPAPAHDRLVLPDLESLELRDRPVPTLNAAIPEQLNDVRQHDPSKVRI